MVKALLFASLLVCSPAFCQDFPPPPSSTSLIRTEVDAIAKTVSIEKANRLRLDQKGNSGFSLTALTATSDKSTKANGFLWILFDTKIEDRFDLRLNSAASFESYFYMDEDEAVQLMRCIDTMVQRASEKNVDRAFSVRFSGKEGWTLTMDSFPDRVEYSLQAAGRLVSSNVSNTTRPMKVTLHGGGEIKKISDYLLVCANWFQRKPEPTAVPSR